MEINKDFLGKLFEQAVKNPRLRQRYDLRTSSNDNSQRILNALLPGANNANGVLCNTYHHIQILSL